MAKFIQYPFMKLHQLAIKAGAKISTSVTSKTTLLVVGKRSGSKLERAFDRGIAILADEEFMNQIK